MAYFERTENGALSMSTLSLRILFDNMFEAAKTKEDVEWILENLQSLAEAASEEKIENL